MLIKRSSVSDQLMSKQTGLDAFRQSNYSGAPWLAKTAPDTVVEFLLDLSTLEPIESTTPWGKQLEADAMMKGPSKRGDIIDEEGDQVAERGKHRIPFWACEALQTVIAEYIDNGGDEDGWIQLAFQRTVSIGRNRDKQRVDINTASWALVDAE